MRKMEKMKFWKNKQLQKVGKLLKEGILPSNNEIASSDLLAHTEK